MAQRLATLKRILQTDIASRHRYPVLGWLSFAIFSCGTIVVAYQALTAPPTVSRWGLWFWVVVGGCFAISDARWLIRRHRKRRRTRVTLRARRHGHCSRCGYDARGNTSSTCPECGAFVGHRGGHGPGR